MQLRNDIKVDVIGITITENQYPKLSCISDVANGNFYSVNSADDFENKFRQAFKSSTLINVVTPPIKVNSLINLPSQIRYKNFAYQFMN